MLVLRCCLSLLIWALMFSALPAAESPAAELPVPNDEETLALELINQLRLHPQRESQRIIFGAQGGISGMKPNVDLALCQKEVAAFPAVPPLVFDQHLIRAARAHAQYMIRVGQTTHDETEGEPGFTGQKPHQRMLHAGYRGMPMMENVYLFPVSMWNAHRGFIIDWGPGPGGMQTGRGHRVSCLSAYPRAVGIGVVPHAKDAFYATVQNYGNHPRVARYVGGVFYQDKNKNARYDIGEGVADVAITADSGESTRTWPSGAYTLILQHRDAVDISVRFNDAQRMWSFAAGSANIRCAGLVPNAQDKQSVQAALNIYSQSAQAMTDALQLWHATKSLAHNSKQAAFIQEQTHAHVHAWQAAQFQILAAFSAARSQAFKQVLAEHKATYRGTVCYQWFKKAEDAYEVYVDAKQIVDNIRLGKGMRRSSISKQVKNSKRFLKKIEHCPHLYDIIEAQYFVLSRTVQSK